MSLQLFSVATVIGGLGSFALVLALVEQVRSLGLQSSSSGDWSCSVLLAQICGSMLVWPALCCLRP